MIRYRYIQMYVTVCVYIYILYIYIYILCHDNIKETCKLTWSDLVVAVSNFCCGSHPKTCWLYTGQLMQDIASTVCRWQIECSRLAAPSPFILTKNSFPVSLITGIQGDVEPLRWKKWSRATQLVSLANLNNDSAAENAEIVRIPNFEPARMHGHGLLQSVPWQSGRSECAKWFEMSLSTFHLFILRLLLQTAKCQFFTDRKWIKMIQSTKIGGVTFLRFKPHHQSSP